MKQCQTSTTVVALYGCTKKDDHRIYKRTMQKNSPNRKLRSSPHFDPDLGWPWKSYRREYLIDL